MDISEIIRVVIPIVIITIFIQIAQKGINVKKGFSLIRIVLIAILLFFTISYFIYDASKGFSAWEVVSNYNLQLGYVGLTVLLTTLGLLILNSKRAYIIAACLYILNGIILGFSYNPESSVPLFHVIGALLYILGGVAILTYGTFINPALINAPGIQFVTKVKKLTFEYIALYIPILAIGVVIVVYGIYMLRVDNFDQFFSFGFIACGLACIVSSILSLIPKK